MKTVHCSAGGCCVDKVSRELDDRSLDVAGLRQLLVLKNRELRNVRKLSQYILQQRNEV